MNAEIIYFAFALMAGASIPIQAAANAALSKSIGKPFTTGLIAFGVGLIGMPIFLLFSRAVPTPQQLASVPI